MLILHARRAAICSLLCGAASVLALHVLRADLDPGAHPLSEYAVGPFGFLMTAAFVALGVGLLAMAIAVGASARTGRRARLVHATVAVAGVGMILSGVFATGSGVALREIVHSRASGASILALIVASLAWSRRPGSDPRRRRLDRAANAAAALAATLGAVSPLLHDTRWTGLGQRLLALALLTWLLLVARQVRPDATAPVRSRLPHTMTGDIADPKRRAT